MGKPKQLLPWKETTLIGNALQTAASASADHVSLVLGANAQVVQDTLKPAEFEVAINENWRSGMGSSISYGLKTLLASETAYDGILVMLGDQPLIDSKYLNTLIRSFKTGETQIVATNYGKHPGVPAIFGKKYFSTLTALEQDKGARQILEKNKPDCTLFEPGNKHLDIDTPDDYKDLLGL